MTHADLVVALMLALQMDLGLNSAAKSEAAERGCGGNGEWRGFPLGLFRSRSPFYLCRWLWFAGIKIKGITVGRRAMTNMLPCLLKPNISPFLSLLSRLQVDAHTRSGCVESQGAPLDGGRKWQNPFWSPKGSPWIVGSEAQCSYCSDRFMGCKECAITTEEGFWEQRIVWRKIHSPG